MFHQFPWIPRADTERMQEKFVELYNYLFLELEFDVEELSETRH